jgi:NCAIR mutase (PurE)-related protein
VKNSPPPENDPPPEHFLDLGHSLPDTSREARCGRPEVIFCPGKTPDQITELLQTLATRHGAALATRATPEQAAKILEAEPGVVYDPVSRLLTLGQHPDSEQPWQVGVLSAGTADQAVAAEAAGTLQFYGWTVQSIRDIGVAGLHRLLARLPEIRRCHVLIVVAGMEGALPTAVGGLVQRPVIAVPTSIGYGASFGGLAPLLTMLNSCASGVTVVNIDNGFGAACAADSILRLLAHPTA